MYMVHFINSHTKRYDDIIEMANDIKTFLDSGPKKEVRVEKYI